MFLWRKVQDSISALTALTEKASCNALRCKISVKIISLGDLVSLFISFVGWKSPQRTTLSQGNQNLVSFIKSAPKFICFLLRRYFTF